MRLRVTKEQLNALTESIIGAAIEVHRELGPGLLEQAYEPCLTLELLALGLESVHAAQLLSYLKFADCRVGLLFNFNVKWLMDRGFKRVVNGFPE
jgi:hypothetical protein